MFDTANVAPNLTSENAYTAAPELSISASARAVKREKTQHPILLGALPMARLPSSRMLRLALLLVPTGRMSQVCQIARSTEAVLDTVYQLPPA